MKGLIVLLACRRSVQWQLARERRAAVGLPRCRQQHHREAVGGHCRRPLGAPSAHALILAAAGYAATAARVNPLGSPRAFIVSKPHAAPPAAPGPARWRDPAMMACRADKFPLGKELTLWQCLISVMVAFCAQ